MHESVLKALADGPMHLDDLTDRLTTTREERTRLLQTLTSLELSGEVKRLPQHTYMLARDWKAK